MRVGPPSGPNAVDCFRDSNRSVELNVFVPTKSRVNRRYLLSVAGTIATAGLAGCAGDEDTGSETVECSTAVRESSGGDIQEAAVVTRRPENDGPLAMVEVTLADDAVPDGPQDDRLGRLSITDSRGELVHEIPIEEPTSERRSYDIAIGPQPQHGQYQFTLEVGGEQVDGMAIDFTCRLSE